MSFVTNIADSAVARAVIEHGQDLFHFLSRRHRATSEDHRLAQETYSRLVRMPVEDLARDPQSYLFRVASNLLHEFELEHQPDSPMRLRREGSRLASVAMLHGDCAVDRPLHRMKVRQSLQALNPLCRAALVLHRRDGMSFERIAERLGTSPVRIRQAFAVGLRQFCSELRDSQ